jgi:predicted cytidylate kinase
VSHHRSVVVNGDPGAGKSAVTLQLAERLQVRRVAFGDVHRDEARKRGWTTQQLNEHAGRNPAIDDYVDNLQREIARSNEPLVVDSRLGWHFFPRAFKVHLVVDLSVAARRAMARPGDAVESYTSIEEAERGLLKRSEDERSRFSTMRAVDQHRLRNYDLVCDTSRASIDAVVDVITAAFHGVLAQDILEGFPPLLLLDPARIYPTDNIRALRDLWGSDFVEMIKRHGPQSIPPIDVGYSGKSFYVISGSRFLSGALQCNFSLIPARLVAEQDEQVVGGWSATHYFQNEVSLTKVYDWEAAHNIQLPHPPHIAERGQPARPLTGSGDGT